MDNVHASNIMRSLFLLLIAGCLIASEPSEETLNAIYQRKYNDQSMLKRAYFFLTTALYLPATIGHEMGHAGVFKLCKKTPLNMHIGIGIDELPYSKRQPGITLHSSDFEQAITCGPLLDNSKQNALLAVSGPICGALSSYAMYKLAQKGAASNNKILSFIGMVSSLLIYRRIANNMMQITPLYGDGKLLCKSLGVSERYTSISAEITSNAVYLTDLIAMALWANTRTPQELEKIKNYTTLNQIKTQLMSLGMIIPMRTMLR